MAEIDTTRAAVLKLVGTLDYVRITDDLVGSKHDLFQLSQVVLALLSEREAAEEHWERYAEEARVLAYKLIAAEQERDELRIEVERWRATAELPPSVATGERCSNCGHTELHNGPAGDVDDACTHPSCNCGFFTPVVTGETPAEPTPQSRTLADAKRYALALVRGRLDVEAPYHVAFIRRYVELLESDTPTPAPVDWLRALVKEWTQRAKVYEESARVATKSRDWAKEDSYGQKSQAFRECSNDLEAVLATLPPRDGGGENLPPPDWRGGQAAPTESALIEAVRRFECGKCGELIGEPTKFSVDGLPGHACCRRVRLALSASA